MKVTLLVILMGIDRCLSLLSPEQYAIEYYNKVDRVYGPLSRDICSLEPYKSSLKSCKLLHQDSNKMNLISSKYASNLNRWNGRDFRLLNESLPRVQSSLSRISTTVRQLNMIRKQLISSYKPKYVSTYQHQLRDTRAQQNSRVRKKRESEEPVKKNPCVSSTSRRATFIRVPDAETGIPLELFQNPNQNYFQTVFVKDCLPFSHPYLTCEVQYLDFMAAVYHPESKDPADVIMRPVKVPASCAMVLLT